MKISDKTSIAKDLVEIEKSLLSISFTRFVFCGKGLYKQTTNTAIGMVVFTLLTIHFQAVKQLRLWAISLPN